MSFSPKQFRDALQQTSKLEKRLTPYLSQTKKQRIDLIYLITEQFHRLLTQNESLLLKVNTLFGIQLFVQTCEYMVIQMIETYLLPLLYEVASYNATKRNYGRCSLYFKEKGYASNTPNIEELSYNYVVIASQLVFLVGNVKEKALFFGEKMERMSFAGQCAASLTARGLKPKEKTPQQQAKLNNLLNLYEKNTQQFFNYENIYLDYFLLKVDQYMRQGIKYRQTLDFRKLLRSGDNYLTSQIIGYINEQLENQNFVNKKNALMLINQFFVWGDMEAIMMVNQGGYIEEVVKRVSEVKGHSDMGKGMQIYPEIPGQADLKKTFYVDFLRILEIWASLYPKVTYNNNNQDSKVNEFYQYLKFDKNFIFPPSEHIKKIKKQFDENMKNSEERNELIIEQINADQTSNNSRSKSLKYMSKYTNKISIIKEKTQLTIFSFSELERFIQQGQNTIKQLNEKNHEKNMELLNKFKNQFQKKFDAFEDDIEPDKLEDLYVRGYLCVEKIEEIDPLYQKYMDGKINFREFTRESEKKMAMVEIRSKQTTPKRSFISQKLSKSINQINKSQLKKKEPSKIILQKKEKQNESKLQSSIKKQLFSSSSSDASSSSFSQKQKSQSHHQSKHSKKSKVEKSNKNKIQVFESRSFTESFNKSNQQIKDIINESQNPDFKIIFQQKQHSKNNRSIAQSKGSRFTKKDQSHYQAVLQSLAPRSNASSAEKDLSISNRSDFKSFRKQNQSQKIGLAQKNNVKIGQILEASSNDDLSKMKSNQKNTYIRIQNKQFSSNKKSFKSSLTQKQKYSSKNQKPSLKYQQRFSDGLASHLESNQNSSYQPQIDSYYQKKPQVVVDLSKVKRQKISEIHHLEQKIKTLKKQEHQIQVTRTTFASPQRPSHFVNARSPRFRENHNVATDGTLNTLNDLELNLKNPNDIYYNNQKEVSPPKKKIFDVIDLFKPPQGKLIYSRLYKRYFNQISNLKQRRKILSNKDLVLKNDTIQIGLMIHREKHILKVVYYITAFKKLNTFLFRVESPDNKIKIEAIPKEIAFLELNKQYRVYIFSQLNQFPYKMPRILFKFDENCITMEQKLWIKNDHPNFSESIVPFYFTKFLQMKPPQNLQKFQQLFHESPIYRGEQFLYNSKILNKHFDILQYYPDLKSLEQKQYESSYGGECFYGSTSFYIKFIMKINKFMYIQAVLKKSSDQANSVKIIEYFVCAVNQLLKKDKSY